MAFSYDPGLSTDVDKLRFDLSDTNANRYAFEDAELSAILSAESTYTAAHIRCIRVLLTDKARRARAMSVDGVTVNDTAAIAGLKTVLSSLGGDAPRFNVVTPALTPMDRGFVEPT